MFKDNIWLLYVLVPPNLKKLEEI